MGLFSQACAAADICGGKDIMGPYAVDAGHWMNRAVVLTPSGSLLRGGYDGYGTVDGREYAIGMAGNVVFHEACWELSGKPTEHDPALVTSGDTHPVTMEDGTVINFAVQGHFVDDDYLIPDPRLAPTP